MPSAAAHCTALQNARRVLTPPPQPPWPPSSSRLQVFDLTDWIPLHPGGPDIIKSLAGTDGTAMFTGMHGSVDADTVMARTLRGFMIGTAEAM